MNTQDAPLGRKDPFIGETLQGFQVEHLLGEGGMGRVYMATQLRLKRPVALKILPSTLVDKNPAFVDRFLREATTAAQLTHPNVVQVYDAGEVRGVFYIAMELVEGQGLDDLLRERKIFPQNQSVEIIIQAARGLEAASKKDLVHRDIKPGNLMITHDGTVKVADFGLAKNTQATAVLTDVGQILGTPAFMSPEQGKGLAADHRSDLYSLGVTLFAMVTGTLPFEGETPVSIVLKHISEPTPDPLERNPRLHPGIRHVILRSMTKEPKERYQSAGEMIEDLEKIKDAVSDFSVPPADGQGIDRKKGVTPSTGQPGELTWGAPDSTKKMGGSLERTLDTHLGERRRSGLLLPLAAALVLAGAAVVLLLWQPWAGEKGGASPKPGGPEPGPPPEVRFLRPERPGIHLSTLRIEVKGIVKVGRIRSVTVNGREADLREDTFTATLDVEEGPSDIRAVLTDESGKEHAFTTRVVADTTPPNLTITLPPPGKTFYTREEAVSIQGLVEELNPAPGGLTVGGTEIESDQGTFTHKLYLEEGAPRKITVTLRDLAGNEASRSVVAVLDRTPPRAVCPGLPKQVESDTPRLRFEVELSEIVEHASVNDRAIAKDLLKKKSFQHEIALTEGDNPIRIKLTDRAGNDGASTLSVRYVALPKGMKPAGQAGRYIWTRDGAEMVPVPGGPFEMGSPRAGGPKARSVAVSPFFIDRHEVSVARYGEFLRWHASAADPRKYSHPDEPSGHSHKPLGFGAIAGKQDLPCSGVNWFSAYAYARWAEKDLPTEAQWEKAAAWNGTRSAVRPWGGDKPDETRCNFNRLRPGSLAVNSLPKGASHWGCLHMSGNVSEWCLDWYAEDLPAGAGGAVLTDPVRSKPGDPAWRVLRGGSWMDRAPLTRTASRRGCPPLPEILPVLKGVGFRCVKNLP